MCQDGVWYVCEAMKEWLRPISGLVTSVTFECLKLQSLKVRLNPHETGPKALCWLKSPVQSGFSCFSWPLSQCCKALRLQVRLTTLASRPRGSSHGSTRSYCVPKPFIVRPKCVSRGFMCISGLQCVTSCHVC